MAGAISTAFGLRPRFFGTGGETDISGVTGAAAFGAAFALRATGAGFGAGLDTVRRVVAGLAAGLRDIGLAAGFALVARAGADLRVVTALRLMAGFAALLAGFLAATGLADFFAAGFLGAVVFLLATVFAGFLGAAFFAVVLAAGLAADFAGVFFAAAVFATGFFAAGFFTADFLAGALALTFLAAVFFATAGLAAVFFAAGFLTTGFFAAGFLAAVFVAARMANGMARATSVFISAAAVGSMGVVMQKNSCLVSAKMPR